MLFRKEIWDKLADGTVTVAIRRQKRPTVKTGGTLQSPAGLLAIDSVEEIQPGDVTVEDARRAGFPDVESSLAELRPEGQLYRVRFHHLGADPRVELRTRDDLAEDELAGLVRTVRRMPYGIAILRLIGANPGVVSTDLAPQLELERLPFKARVRRLKALGLTESLKVGYQLSPRGEALLARAGDELES